MGAVYSRDSIQVSASSSRTTFSIAPEMNFSIHRRHKLYLKVCKDCIRRTRAGVVHIKTQAVSFGDTNGCDSMVRTKTVQIMDYLTSPHASDAMLAGRFK